MSKANRMTGIAWHVETLHRSEGDVRRHKNRCIHYCSETKECDLYPAKCHGSSQCKYYQEEKVATSSYLDTLPDTTRIVYDKGKKKKGKVKNRF